MDIDSGTQQNIVNDIVGDDLSRLPVTNTALETGVNIVFMFAGIVALIFVVYGGFKYVISGGDPQKVAAAKDTIVYAVIGLIVALSSFIIIRLVIGVAQS